VGGIGPGLLQGLDDDPLDLGVGDRSGPPAAARPPALPAGGRRTGRATCHGGRMHPSRAAAARLESPAAQASTIRQRHASAWLLVRRWAHRSRVWRSSSVKVICTVGRPRRRLDGGSSFMPRAYHFHSEPLTRDTRSLMRFSVLVAGVLVVVGDQGTLGRGADLPVEPDRGVEREQALHDTRPQPGWDPAARAVQAELVLQRPDDRLDPLPQPVREAPVSGSLVRAGRTMPSSRPASAVRKSRPAKPLSATSSVPGAGRLAGTPCSMPTTAWRSPTSLGVVSRTRSPSHPGW
jgi:hypothetical protein